MIDINKMSIKEIDDYCHLQLIVEDIQYCLNKSNPYEELQKVFGNLQGREFSKNKLINFLEENEPYLDKEKLILISLQHYKEVQELERKADELMQQALRLRGFTKEEIEKYIKKTLELAETLRSKNIVFLQKEIDKGKNIIKVISSKMLLKEPLSVEERKRQKTTQKAIKRLPHEAILSALVVEDNQEEAPDIFTVPHMGEYIFETAAANSFLDKGLSQEEILHMIAQKKFKEYCYRNLLSITSENIKDAFEGIEQYINIEKMCLNAFMDIVNDMENGDLLYPIISKRRVRAEVSTDHEKKHFANLEQLLPIYYSVFAKSETEIQVGDRVYTTKDAKKAMDKYIDGKYMSECGINEQINHFIQDGVPVSVMTAKQLQYIRQYIIKQRGFMSIRELNKMLDVGLVDGHNILKMYEDRRLSLENMSEVGKHTELDSLITPQFILEKFNQLSELDEENDQYEEETIKRYVDLYKEIFLNGKTEEQVIKAGKALLQVLEQKSPYPENMKKQEDLLQYGLLSERTYAMLANEGMIDMDNFLDKYQKGYISIDTIKKLYDEGKQFQGLNLEQKIIDAYMKIREQEHPNFEELKKYGLLYTELKLKDLPIEEQTEMADELIMQLGERIENDIEEDRQHKEFGKEDRKRFYELGIIPIDTVVLWAENNELLELLTSKVLIPKDVRRLYLENRVSLHDIQEIIEMNHVSLEQKISLINIIFPTPEEAEIRNSLFEKIADLDTSVHSEHRRAKKYEKNVEEEKHTPKQEVKKYIFDTAVRYNAFIESDENVKMETFRDGHIAAHLPSIKGGIVVLEQLYKLTRGQDGKKSMGEMHGAKAFILTEEEYDRYRDEFINTENRVSRAQLAELALRILPNLEEKGIIREISHFKNKYPKEMQILLGVPESLAKAMDEDKREKALKQLEDSEQYNAEEIEKMIKRNKAWEQVRNSRRLYTER